MPLLPRLARLLRSHGELRTGSGLATGVVATMLATLCLLGVLAFRFPEYLTTPQLRAVYPVAWLRELLYWALVVAGALALFGIVTARVRWVPALAFALVVLAVALGGHRVPGRDVAEGTPYVGLDWFVLDLLGSALVFVVLEKLWPLRPAQPVFRAEWQTDLQYFVVTHLGIGVLLLAVNLLVHPLVAWLADDGVQARVRDLPFVVALLALMLVADLVQYAVHRAYHEVPWLWRFHAVHHSVETMDWLAGSRLHLFEVVVTRALVLVPIYALGFDKPVIDAYIVVAGFQAVLNHANVNLRVGPLRHVFVTPAFHHWHHAQDREAIDRNYAAHFAFIDRLFGTVVVAQRTWPERYGVVGNDVPRGFWRQLVHPFMPRRGG
jgi:sterol desaturase/sphingolipid hydroxylase (fatty acid hydroxylase superfamily)